MAGSAEPFSERDEYSFLRPPPSILPPAGVTELKASDGDLSGIPTVDLKAELKKEAATGGADLLTLDDLEDHDGAPLIPPPGAKLPAPAVPTPTPARSRESTFFSTSYATALELDRALIEKYGVEWLDWEPETIWQTIRMDWNTQISRINMDKIMAAKLLHVSDSFWRNWDVFQNVVLAFNNVTPLFDRVQDVTVGQVMHALNQAAEIRKEEFQTEVKYYIAHQAREEGFLWLPSPADLAQKELDQLNPPEMVPLKQEIRDRWEAFKDLDLRNIEFPENVYGVHLARLAAIDLYLSSVSSPELTEDI
jgi:hypothetical protein